MWQEGCHDVESMELEHTGLPTYILSTTVHAYISTLLTHIPLMHISLCLKCRYLDSYLGARYLLAFALTLKVLIEGTY